MVSRQVLRWSVKAGSLVAAGEAEPLSPAAEPAAAAAGRNAAYGVALSGNGLLAATLRDSGNMLSGKRTLPQWQRCVLATVELLRGVGAADLPAAARRAAAALPTAPLTPLRLWDVAVGLRLARVPAAAAAPEPGAAPGPEGPGPEGSGEGSAGGVDPEGGVGVGALGEAGPSSGAAAPLGGALVAQAGEGGPPGASVPCSVAEVQEGPVWGL